MSRRERIGSRYITRKNDGTFSKNVDVGRSLSADRRRKAKTQVKSGQGDKGDIKMAEDKHPKLSARAKSAYVFPKRQAYPIGDLKHGKYALIFSTWPENKKDAKKVREVVFKRYPQLRKWFEGGKYEKKDVPDEYNAESFKAEAGCGCGNTVVMNAEGNRSFNSCGCGTKMGAETFEAEYDSVLDYIATRVNRPKMKNCEECSYMEHDACPMIEGCPCCDNTRQGMMGAETFEARTYRKTPARKKGEKPSKTAGKMRRFRKLQSARKSMAAQGYDDKLDESMGMRDGSASTMSQTMQDRRNESKGMEKAMGDRAYSGVRTMDNGGRNIPRGIAPNMHFISQKELEQEARKNRNMKDAENFNADEKEQFEEIEGKISDFDVVGTAQDVVGKTGVNIPTGVASLAVLWVAFMTGKKYGN